MKTAISLPDDDFARFERLAARHGLNRSEFFRLAGQHLADELEGGSRLTALADAVLTSAGRPDDPLFLAENHRASSDSAPW